MYQASRKNQKPPPTRSTGQTGFTVLEVVLAISLGLFVLGGVTVGYVYGKRAMIVNNQRTEILTFKTFIEDARSAKAAAGISSFGPDLNVDQMCGIVQKIPSMLIDPYNGNHRVPATAGSGNVAGPCAGDTATGSGSVYFTNDLGGPPAITFAKGTDLGTAAATASSVIYVNCDNSVNAGCGTTPPAFNFNLISGTTQTVYGYAIVETDGDGNIVAVAGGDNASP